jgi:hypothetical protein
VSSSHAEQAAKSRLGDRRRFFIALTAALVCVAAGVWFILFTQMPGGSGIAVAESKKGIVDYRLEDNPLLGRAPLTAETAALYASKMGSGPGNLGARWTRVLVYWNALQPDAPSGGDPKYVAGYLSQLDIAVHALTHPADGSPGINVILTPTGVPQWAGNPALWKQPAPGYQKDAYQPFYAMNTGSPLAMNGLKELGRFLASRYSGSVSKFEAWNEPNIWRGIYPQKLGSNRTFAQQVYLKMLAAYSAGVKSGQSGATVIAGATAPTGNASKGGTSPIVWAKFLSKKHAGRYFGAYSHHPYTVLGTRNPSPSALPNNPSRTVTLANIGTLLKIFPSKPFYLTEYGYSTSFNPVFGYPVSEQKQADYLKTAYAMVAKRKQIKALLWFLVEDLQPSLPGRTDGVATGLASSDGLPKPSWTAFANLP